VDRANVRAGLKVIATFALLGPPLGFIAFNFTLGVLLDPGSWRAAPHEIRGFVYGLVFLSPLIYSMVFCLPSSPLCSCVLPIT